MLEWILTQNKVVLDRSATSNSWRSQWLEVLKESAEKGFYPEMPEYGFGDPKSYAIMEDFVKRMRNKGVGSVRHGAECFNFYFPQELDDKFLVICNSLLSNNTLHSSSHSYSNDIKDTILSCGRTTTLFSFSYSSRR